MRKSLLLLLFCVLVAAGCSGGSSVPVVPTDNSTAGSIDSLPLIDGTFLADSGFEATGLLGAYGLSIDPENMTADLVSKRFGAIGEGYIVSGIGFFTMVPCSSCLTLSGIIMNIDGTAELTFTAKHPFAPGNPAEPPTAANRLDLSVFDLAAVVAPAGEPTMVTYPLLGTGIFTGLDYGPDGYTLELDPITTLGAALPYFLVVDDSLGTESTFNKFAQGDSVDFGIGFDLSSGSLQFDLYLTMGYGASAKKLQRLTPKYYNPEFNRNAAWKVNAIPAHGTDVPTQENTWNDLDAVGTFDVTVEVYDWQAGAVVTADPLLFADAAVTEVFASSEVASVSAEVPGMTAALATELVADSGTGAFDDPFVYTVALANENLLPIGEYTGLVKVLDERAPAADWATEGRDFLIDSPDGILLNNYNLPEYATYQTFPAVIVTGCGPITGTIDVPVCPVTGVSNGGFVPFTVSATSDNGGGAITLYEVDFDYDGTTFAADDSNTDGIFASVGPFMVADPCLSNIPQDFTVAFRATDSCDIPNVTIFATCLVTVDTCLEVVGNTTIVVNRAAPNSYGYPIDPTGPWTLEWPAAGGAVEYAIYYDADPSDGLTNSLTYVDATAALTYIVPASHLPSNHYVVGNTYVVRSRSTAGDPGSEAADGQPAFITVNGWETLSSNSNPGWSNDGEGWHANSEGTYSWYYARPRITTNYTAHGSYQCNYSPFVGPGYATYGGEWQGIMKETPTVADSSVRWVETSTYSYQHRPPTGIFMGTCSATTPPHGGWTTTTDLEWGSVSSAGLFSGYNYNSTDVSSTFDDVPAGNNAWTDTGSWNRRQLWGGDMNVDGDSSDPLVAIQHINSSISTQDYTRLDELAIIIY